ncbi:MAG: solute carrier family 23 protein [Lachnospirales bacterium]
MLEFVNKHFGIEKYNSTIKREIMAGITNYFTLIYIVLLVPEMLMDCFNSYDTAQNGILISLSVVSFLITGISSIILGFFTNLPLVQGPSMVIAIFITTTICNGLGYSYNQALAIVFISGILFFIMSYTGIENKIQQAIPKTLKYAIASGIGFMIITNGLYKGDIIKKSGSGIELNNIFSIKPLVVIIVVILIIYMLSKKIHAGIFIGKIVCIIVSIPLGLINISNSESLFKFPFKFLSISMDFSGLFNNGILTLLLILITICIMDIFETISVFVAIDSFTGLSHREINKKAITGILEIDALNTTISSFLGITNISTYAESTAGIIEGGRTGFTAVVSGILFILTLPIVPLVSLVPSVATATTLIASGIIMTRALRKIEYDNITELFPSILLIILMPLTGSVLLSFAIGLITYVLVHLFTNKKPNIYMIMLSVFLIIMLYFMPL